MKAGYTTGVRRMAARARWDTLRARASRRMRSRSQVSRSAPPPRSSSTSSTAPSSSRFWLERLLFLIGSVLDILDGALARSSGKGTPFGAFLDSTTDRIGEGFMLGAIALVFSRDGNEVALAFAFAAVAGSFLVSYTRARAEALGLKGDVGIGSRAERVAVIVAGLVLAPWGALPWAIYLLTVTAWITVVQRVLAVRAQLRAALILC